METTYNDCVVKITSTTDWSYDSMRNEAILKIAPDLHGKVQKVVDNYIENKDAIEAEKEKQEAAKKEEVRVKKVVAFNEAATKFAKEVNEMEIVKKSGLVAKPRIVGANCQMYHMTEDPREISFDKLNSNTLSYNGKVWDGWHTTTTNKPWVVEIDYKKVRYATLENALNKMIVRVTNAINQKKADKERADKEEFGVEQIEKYCTKRGLKYSKEWIRGYSKGSEIHFGTFAKTKLKLVYNHEKAKVVVTSIRIESPSDDIVEKAILGEFQ